MKKILLVSVNSGDVFIGELATRLAAREYDVWRYFVKEGRLHHYNSTTDKWLVFPAGNGLVSLFKMIVNSLKVGRHLGKVDFVHYHYIDTILGILFFFLFPLSRKRTIATFWGSDYYKSSTKSSILKRRLLKRAGAITFTNPVTQNAFGEQYPQWAEKTSTIRFGLIPLDHIAKLTAEDRLRMKQKLRLPLDKKLVCLGTNASVNQNHEAIFNALKAVHPEVASQLHFLVPLGYPKQRKVYIQKISSMLSEDQRSSYTFDSSFYSGKELAAYRACTDILIQTQTTDQFSGAMQEVMASNGDVITGSWLPYEVLKGEQVHFHEIESFEELPAALEVVCKYPITQEQARHNAKVINKLSNWNEVILGWVNLYA